jgi:hypothetical protein
MALTISLPLHAAAQAPPPAKEIIARYVSAIGGEKAFLSREAWETTGQFSMPAAGISGTVEIYAAGGRALARIVIPGIGEVMRGHDGKVGWSVNPMEGPRLLQGAEESRLAEESQPGASLWHSSVVTSVETLEKTAINGEDCWKVKTVWKSGRETFDCFSVASGLYIGSTGKLEMPMGVVDYTTVVSNYKDFGNVKVPTRIVQTAMGQEQIITVTSYKVTTVDPAKFALPPTVKALIK